MALHTDDYELRAARAEAEIPHRGKDHSERGAGSLEGAAAITSNVRWLVRPRVRSRADMKPCNAPSRSSGAARPGLTVADG